MPFDRDTAIRTRGYDCRGANNIGGYLADLSGLHQLIADRRKACDDPNEHLCEFIVLGRWVADSCGNFGRCEIGSYSSKDVSWIPEDLPPVILVDELLKLLKSCRLTISFDGLPPQPDSICPECGLGWTIDTAHDFVRLRSRDGKSDDLYEHGYCHQLSAERDVMEEFRGYLEKAGLGRALMTAIPNEYWPSSVKDGAEPWCLVRTPYGTFKMGWRKRVLSIDWNAAYDERLARIDKLELDERYEARQKLREAFDAKVLFPNEDVTRWETGIHAWGADKAVEYLKVVREKVLCKP